MEDVLEENEKPYDPEYPLICMDEKPKEIHGQARDPLPAKPPPEEDAAFIAWMEDVLEENEKPYDPEYPLICMDEKPKEIHGQARDPLPAKPGKGKIEESEYVRNGHACVFVFTNPNTGWIEAHVSERRTKKDWAREIKWLVDEAY